MARLPQKDTAIRQLTKELGKTQTEYRDEKTPGLSLLVGERAKSWYLTYTPPEGKRKRIKLGRYPAVGLAAARDRVDEVYRTLHQGTDPAKAREAYKESFTVASAGEEYLRLYAANKVTHRMDEAVFRNDVNPEIGDHKLVSVTRQDVQAVIRRVLDRGSGFMANRTLEIIRKFFAWCVEQGWIDTNPAFGISKPKIEKPRSRILSNDELRQMWAALEHTSSQSRMAIKLLLLTGQREMEVILMRWSEIDLERGVWTLPADEPGRSKKRSTPHILPLSPAVVAILDELRKLNPESDMVFRAKRRNGVRGNPTRSMVANAKIILDEKYLNFSKPWRIHDLRRTFRTGLSQLSVPPHIAELVIGHAASGLVKVYDRYDYLGEKREALLRWADHLLTLVGEREGAENVFTIGAQA